MGEFSQSSQGLFTRACSDVAAGDVRVLQGERLPDHRHGKPVGRQAVGVDPKIDRAACSAFDVDTSDAGRPFNLNFDEFVRQFGELSEGTIPRDGEAEHRSGIVVELQHCRWQRGAR